MTERLTASDLPIRLDPTIRSQALRVHAALRTGILEGLLPAGLKLPSSRALAMQLGMGRNAVVAAYEHLLSDGLVETRQGAGTFVAAGLPAPQAAPSPPMPPVERPDRGAFALGRTHVEPAFLARLGAAVRRRIAGASLSDLDYGDPRGSAHLRQQIARFLAVHRGIRCDPACIVIVSGTQHGLRLCANALLSPGDPVWVEDPGYDAAKTALTAAGARLIPVSVDREGIDIAAGIGAAPHARAVYVTPSHQFPTGVTLSMRRRVALLDWAQRAGAWVFEDDYDSEFRYAGPPLTALAGLSAERVIYIGTFAKTLFPGLRLGYLVLPPSAVRPVLAERAAFDRFPQKFLQDAVADVIADGTVAAHLRRMRTRYAAARELLIEALPTASGGLLHPDAPDQGLHLIAYLAPEVDPGCAPWIRDRAGIVARLLSETRLIPGGREGFVLGFSGHTVADLRDGAARLGAATQEAAAVFP
ncbi:MAG: PLP-dependent aminotransferase family protein [Rhodobacteraceae bacterium]|nr:PLP-dependent aminotransferase family protein [Paracoccaceae bacterium]